MKAARWAAACTGLSARLLVVLSCLVGCQPKKENAETAVNPALAKVSDIPLRVRVVGELSDPGALERRWLAESEQPIDIQTQSVDEFLADEENASDVLLFPSHLLGELVQRDWVLKLPELPQPLGTDDDQGTVGGGASAAADVSSRYGGEQYAVPLGCSIPQFIASSSLATELSTAGANQLDPTVELPTLRQWLQNRYGDATAEGSSSTADESSTTNENSTAVDGITPDREALVDRFLALMLLFTERDPQYGLLFDIDTLEPRLASEEGLQAVEFLRLMLQQDGGGVAVFGSHDAAWQWAANHDRPVVALAAASMLGPEARQIAAGQELRVGTDRYINAGRALLVGVSSNCRQTLQSLNFIAWVSRPSTTQVLAPLTRGVDPARPLSIDASAWRLRQNLAEALSNDRLPQEPRFPAAHLLRTLIADALLAILRDGQPAEVVLADAEQKWQASAADRATRSSQHESFERAYKTSLGLRSR